MTRKIYKIVFILFALELILIFVGISANKISYGTGLGTAITQIGIVFLLLITTIIIFTINKLETKRKNGLRIFMIILMLFSMVYFLVENTFKVKI
jgi:hypothetical protein